MLTMILLACSSDGEQPEASDDEQSESSPADDTSPDTDDTSDTSERPSYPSLPALDEQILDEMEASAVPGLSACIVKGNTTVWCAGYGYADLEEGRTVTPQTPFMLASISKVVAGMALAHAAETGHLKLDNSVNEYLPFSVHHPTSSTDITGRMLAAHVSSIKDNWEVMNALYTNGDPVLALGDFMKAYLTPEGEHYLEEANFTIFSPLESHTYSNIGAALMGYLIESATGQDFSDYCEGSLFVPMGLENTGWHLADLDVESIAVPYTVRQGNYRPVEHYGFPDYPSGQLRSSAEDMAEFLRLMMNEGRQGDSEIVSADTIEELMSIQFPSLDNDQGLSLYRWRMDGDLVWGHNGGELGVSTEMLFWPDQKTGVVVLMNGEGRHETLYEIEALLREAAADL